MTNDQLEGILRRMDLIIEQLMIINQFEDQKSQILHLHKRNFTPSEISDILNTTSNTVSVTISRNKKKRKKFRRYLEERLIYLDEVIKEYRLEFDPKKDWDESIQTFNCIERRDISLPYFFSLEQPIDERNGNLLPAGRRSYAWVPLKYFP